MTTWVVDDGPLGLLAQVIDPSHAWPARTLHVLEAVVRGAPRDKSGRRTELLAMRTAGEPVIVQHALVVGTPADVYLATHLRADATSATDDLGEHESIAWIRHEGPSDSVFVTFDKGAAFLALAELGPSHVATPFDLWADLQQRALITHAQLDDLCTRFAKAWNLRVPPRIGALAIVR